MSFGAVAGSTGDPDRKYGLWERYYLRFFRWLFRRKPDSTPDLDAGSAPNTDDRQ